MGIGRFNFANPGGAALLGQGINEGVEGGINAYTQMQKNKREQQAADFERGTMHAYRDMNTGGGPDAGMPQGAGALATRVSNSGGGDMSGDGMGGGMPEAPMGAPQGGGFDMEYLPQEQGAAAIASNPPSPWAPAVGEQDLEKLSYEATKNLNQRNTNLTSADDVARNAYPLMRHQTHLQRQMGVLDGALKEMQMNPKDPTKWVMLERLFPGQDPMTAKQQAAAMQREFLTEYNENQEELGPLMEAGKKLGVPQSALSNKAALLQYLQSLQKKVPGRVTGPNNPLLRRGYGHR